MVKISKDVKTRGVSESEIKFAKDYLRGSMALSFESSDEIATFLGEQSLFYKKIETPDEVLRHIEKVTRGDIMKAVKELVRPDKMNLAVIGPHRDSKDYINILKRI